MEDPIENKLKSIAHPTRRIIIKSLAEKGPLSYTDLMRISGTRDSGTFAFHLRNLKGLVRKNEYGDYELTDEGWDTYRALKILEGKKERIETTPVLEKSMDEAKKPKIEKETIRISDRISFDMTQDLLERLRKDNKKLMVTDTITVNIHKVDPELLEEVLEGITDVVIVNVPKDLKSMVELKSTDVVMIKSYEGDVPKNTGVFGGFTGFLGSMIGGILSSILGQLGGLGFQKEPRQKFSHTLDVEGKKNIGIELDVRNSKVSMKDNVDAKSKLDLDIWVKEKSDYEISEEEGLNKIVLDGGQATLKVPENTGIIGLKSKHAVVEADLEKTRIKEIKLDGKSSILNMGLKKLETLGSEINLSSSTMNATLSFEEFVGETNINLQLVSCYFNLTLEVPDKTAVKIDVDTPSSAIIVEGDGQKASTYLDPNYRRSNSRINVTGTAKYSTGKIVIKRI